MHILRRICNVCHVVPNQQLSLFLFERACFFLLLQASDSILEWLLVCVSAQQLSRWEHVQVLVLMVALTVHQSDRQVERQAGGLS